MKKFYHSFLLAASSILERTTIFCTVIDGGIVA